MIQSIRQYLFRSVARQSLFKAKEHLPKVEQEEETAVTTHRLSQSFLNSTFSPMNLHRFRTNLYALRDAKAREIIDPETHNPLPLIRSLLNIDSYLFRISRYTLPE